MLNETISFVILLVFTSLFVIAAVTTGARWLRYRRTKFRRPKLLNRDVVLVNGLAIPFVLVALNRALDWSEFVTDADRRPEWWWLLLTGLPAIVAIAVYVYFELFVIERDQEDAPPPPHEVNQ